MRKPVIGIAPDFNPGAGKGGSESEATIFIRNRYVTAVAAAGGIPVILPVITKQAVSIALLDRLDAPVLAASGPDVDPRRYGEPTRLHDVLGRSTVQVNSSHRQAVKTVPRALAVSAVAPDGVIEALEDRGRRFFIGVQWHPEYLYPRHRAHRALFEALVAAARGSRRAVRRPAAKG